MPLTTNQSRLQLQRECSGVFPVRIQENDGGSDLRSFQKCVIPICYFSTSLQSKAADNFQLRSVM